MTAWSGPVSTARDTVIAEVFRGPAPVTFPVLVLSTLLVMIVAVVLLYTIRHYLFTLNRLFGRQRHPYTAVQTADWPDITLLIPAHNEELVIGQILEALLRVDYPRERLRLLPVNDRSTDRTSEILYDYAARYPMVIFPVHRNGGKPGKAAALREVMEKVTTGIVLVFDADYIPSRGLIKQLVAPFFDPEVGAVMGRVVPLNSDTNLLTRLLDLERAGGYQVDQQARMNLHLVPQYGGTVGGVRTSALREIGGWRDDTLTEDTDLTYRLLLRGWLTVYQNRSECYEEVPESWPLRVRQIRRWADGHNQAMGDYFGAVLRGRMLRGALQRTDALMLLGVYALPPLIAIGWLITIALFYLAAPFQGIVAILAVAIYGTMGNSAAFFEIATACWLDGSRNRAKLLPLVFFGFLISIISVTASALNWRKFSGVKQPFVWEKTHRYGRGPNES